MPTATSIQQMLEAGLPLLLLAHTMDPTTGALPPPPPSVADALPEEDSEVEAGLAAAATAPPPPPTPIDFGRPMVSSAARLQVGDLGGIALIIQKGASSNPFLLAVVSGLSTQRVQGLAIV